jgi:hypothetical protein
VRLVPLALLPLLAAGCGSSNVVAVSGRVTLDGKPLANAHVGFQPLAQPGKVDAGGGSYAITDSDGRYSLRMVESDAPGAVVGKHRVEIVLRGTGADDDTDRHGKPPKPPLPARYNQESKLTFDVPAAGTKEANFELESK